jgi:hypothetical protein
VLLPQLSHYIRFQITVKEQRHSYKKNQDDTVGATLAPLLNDGATEAQPKPGSKSKAKKSNKGEEEAKAGSKSKANKNVDPYLNIAGYMVDFLKEREVIELNDDMRQSESPVRKIKGTYTRLKKKYVLCNFDLSLLPIKLNLPMVSPPHSWEPVVENPSTINHLTGGYLTQPTGEMVNRYRLLTSHDYDNFNVYFHDKKSCLEFGELVSWLQSKACEINSRIQNYYYHLLTRLDSFIAYSLAKSNFRKYASQ